MEAPLHIDVVPLMWLASHPLAGGQKPALSLTPGQFHHILTKGLFKTYSLTLFQREQDLEWKGGNTTVILHPSSATWPRVFFLFILPLEVLEDLKSWTRDFRTHRRFSLESCSAGLGHI